MTTTSNCVMAEESNLGLEYSDIVGQALLDECDLKLMHTAFLE